MMFQLAEKRPIISHIEVPALVMLVTAVWIITRDLWRASQPRRARGEVYILAHCDKCIRELKGYRWLVPVATTFTSFWCVFSLIEMLEGGIKWLQ